MPNFKMTFEEELQMQREAKALLEQELRAAEKYPETIIAKQEESSRTLPAWDEPAHRKKQDEFDTRVSKCEIRNKRRELSKSVFLMVLLTSACVAIAWWVYRLYLRNDG